VSRRERSEVEIGSSSIQATGVTEVRRSAETTSVSTRHTVRQSSISSIVDDRG
jgi:hypothetical protein